MKLLLVLITVVFTSCSTTSNKGNGDSTVDAEFDWVENNDFLPVNEVKYIEGEDKFDDEIIDYDALSVESIARLPEPKLSLVTQSRDNISKVISLCYRKEFEKAFAILDGIYRQYKKNPSYWNQVGSCHLIKGDKRKALLFYNKALDLSKNYVPPINNVGVLHMKNEYDQKALAAFKRAYELNRFSLTPIYNLATLYLKYGHIDKANKFYRALYKNNQKDQDVIFALATINLIDGNIERAVNLFRKLNRKKISEFGVGTNYAIALRMRGDVSNARSLLNSVQRPKTHDEKLYYAKVSKFIGK